MSSKAIPVDRALLESKKEEKGNSISTKFQIKLQGFKYKSFFKTYPLQQYAFDFIDDKGNDNEDNVKADDDNCLSFSLEPRLFAVEYNSEGKRRYVVSHLGRFMHHYWIETEASGRHYYELIREGTPCRLYFGESSFLHYNRR